MNDIIHPTWGYVRGEGHLSILQIAASIIIYWAKLGQIGSTGSVPLYNKTTLPQYHFYCRPEFFFSRPVTADWFFHLKWASFPGVGKNTPFPDSSVFLQFQKCCRVIPVFAWYLCRFQTPGLTHSYLWSLKNLAKYFLFCLYGSVWI